MASVSSASQSSLSSASVSASVSAAAPAASASVSNSAIAAAPAASASVSAAPVPAASASVSASRSSSSVSSASISLSSSSASASHSPTLSTVVLAPAATNAAHGDGQSSNNNVGVIVPIAAVACALIIVYFAYRLYLLHKRRKEERTPLPPPRLPAVMEQRRPQSVMYSNPAMGPPPVSYRNSMRPASFMYAPSHSGSSITLSKGGSGNSTPTQPPPMYADESGRFSPAPPSSMRGHTRPMSVASYGTGSMRHSTYGGQPRRPASSYLDRVDIVLPQPLATQDYVLPSPGSRQSRYSVYSTPSNPEMKSQAISPLAAPVITAQDDEWISRAVAAADADAESTSTCTAQRVDTAPPPPPPKPMPTTGSSTPLSRQLSPSPSRDPHIPGAFPSSPSTQRRSFSPPEPLLSSNAFVGSMSGSLSASGESDEDRRPSTQK